jgi:diguanylate cyclase (GGDEF)-like protein
MHEQHDPWPSRANLALGTLTGTAYGLVDNNLIARWASESYRRIFGIEPLGRSLFDFIHPDDLEFASSVVLFHHASDTPTLRGESTLERTSPATDVRLLTHDGTYRTCMVSVDNRLDDPEVCAFVVRIDCSPDRSGIGRSLDLIAAGATMAQIGQCIAEFIPQDFDPQLNLCVALQWNHDDRRHAVASRGDFSSALIASLSHPSLDLPARTVEDIIVTPTSELAGFVADEVVEAAVQQGFSYLWRVPIWTPEHEECIGVILVWSTNGYTLSLRPEMHVSIGRHLFKLALIEQRRREKLTIAARTDSLSGLMNRVGLSDHFASLTDDKFPILAMLIDLDEFKSINDRFGHGAGDLVIAETGRRLAHYTGLVGVAARLGGDEFLWIATNYHGDVALDGARISEALSVPLLIGDNELEIAASVGGAVAQGRVEFADILERADRRLYKEKGRKQLVGH